MSDGNGHPYSWSAIINGYDSDYMNDCPFPLIPKYLAERNFPEDSLCEIGVVNSIWTQEKRTSEHISKAAFIENVCENINDLVNYSDAVLLARDDDENHLEMARFFLGEGVPIFVDKPFSTSVHHAIQMLDLQKYDHQIFTCSSLRYAKELIVSSDEFNTIGELREVVANCPKYWNTYAVHLLEPIIVNCSQRGELLEVHKVQSENHTVHIKWQQLIAKITMTGQEPSSLEFTYIGDKGSIRKQFRDSFSCFKSSLKMFIDQVHKKENLIPREETMEIVTILENGK